MIRLLGGYCLVAVNSVRLQEFLLFKVWVVFLVVVLSGLPH